MLVVCGMLLTATAVRAGIAPQRRGLSPRQQWALRHLLDTFAEAIQDGSRDRVLGHFDESVGRTDREACREGLDAEFAGYRYQRVRFAFDPATGAEWEDDSTLRLRTVMHCAYAPRDDPLRSNDPGTIQKFRLRWDGSRFRVLSCEWTTGLPSQNEKTFFTLLFWWGAALLLIVFFWVASTLYVAERTRNLPLVLAIFLLPVVGAAVYFLAAFLRTVLFKKRRPR